MQPSKFNFQIANMKLPENITNEQLQLELEKRRHSNKIREGIELDIIDQAHLNQPFFEKFE